MLLFHEQHWAPRSSRLRARSSDSQRGVALLTALLAAVLASVAALEILEGQQLALRRTANLLNSDQAYLFVVGAEMWALGILARDARENQVDGEWELWAKQLPPIPVEGGAVWGKIQDLQARFNLNNLVQDGQVSEIDLERFQRLLHILELEPQLAQALLDWLDPDIDPRIPAGAEDDEYQRMNPPYRCPNGPITSISELRLIRGFTEETYQRLRPFVTALPQPTPINVNSASLEVLRALADPITENDAQMLIDERADQGFEDLQTFLQHPALAGTGDQVSQRGLALDSHFFLLSAGARIGQGQAQLFSLLKRNQERVQVVMRRRAGFE